MWTEGFIALFFRFLIILKMASPEEGDERMNTILRMMQGLTPSKRRETMSHLGKDYAAINMEDLEGDTSLTQANGGPAKVVVETASALRRLRTFSGRKPLPSGEVDYATWRLSALQITQDTAIKEAEKKRIIMYSLLRPALEVVRELANSSSKEIVNVLDAAFGVCVDGQELFVKFLSCYQCEKEEASEYLQRLYISLLEVVDHQGIESCLVAETLMNQFVRGCREEDLLSRLRLEDKRAAPSFSELLLLVRKEETRRQDKKSRLGKAGRVAAVTQATSQSTSTPVEVQVKALQKQVAELTRYVKEEKPQHQSTVKPSGSRARMTSENPSGSSARMTPENRKRTIFCYKCGEDGHVRSSCTGKKNSELVQEKLIARATSSGNGRRQP